MTTKKTRASHGRRPVPSLTAKEWPEAVELVHTMSGPGEKRPPGDCELSDNLFTFVFQTCQILPQPSYFSALAKCGVWFKGYADPKEYPAPLAEYVGWKRPQPQQCFYNSLMAVLIGPAAEVGLSYFEGYTMIPGVGLPIEHAWLGTDAGGVAVDLTLPMVERKKERVSEIRAGTVYCGVKIPSGLLHRQTVAEEIAAPRLPDWLTAAVDYVKGLE